MADPITSAIMAVVNWVGGSFAASAAGTATLAQVATVAAVNVAVSVSATALMAPEVGAGGSPTAFKADPSAPIRGVMGRVGVGGTQIHMRSWGKENVFLSFMTVLSLGPISSIYGFTANTLPVTFPGAQGMATSGPYVDKMWQTSKLGLPTDAALGPPTGQAQGTPAMSEWTSAHKSSGHAAVFWTMRNNSKRAGYEGGVPQPLWSVNGMLVWDPREDSTYPGGSGAQRRDNWTTWAWSENPYLHALAFARGHHKNLAGGTIDRTKRLAGIGAPDRGIDIAAFVEGANVADANGWTISGEWTTADDKWSVLAAMLQAGGGVPLNRSAQISVMVNTPRASLYSYTGSDLVGPANLKVMASRRDRFNAVIPRYRSEAQKWEVVAAGAVTASTYVTEDRDEPRTREIEYSYVRLSKQAAELAAYDLANARETLTGTLPSKPHLLGLRAGDAFAVNEPELGLNGQKMVVMKRGFDPASGVVTLEVRSETEAKHAWALGQTDNPPPTPALTAIDPSTVPEPEAGSWAGAAEQITSANGQIPIIRITGGLDKPASAIVVDYKPSVKSVWSSKSFPTDAVDIELAGLTGATAYDVRIRYASPNGVADPAVYLSLGPITTGNYINALGQIVDANGNPIDLDDIANDQVAFSAKRTYGGFASMAPFTLSDLTASFPVNTSTVRLTPTGASPYFQIDAVNRTGADSYVIRVRLKAAAAITAAQWNGTVLYSTPGHSVNNAYRKDIPFPPGGLPVGKWKLVEFDMSDLTAGGDDFIDSDIEQVRFYLAAAGGPAIDVDFLSFGTRGVDPLDLREVEDGATDGATAGDNVFRSDGVTPLTQAEIRTIEGTAAFLDGEGALARRDTVGSAHIEARAVKPTQLYAADRSNLFPDPDLGDDAIWTTVGNTAKLLYTGAMGSEYLRRLTDVATTNYFELNPAYAIEVKPGQAMFFGMAGYINASDGSETLSVRWYSDIAATTLISTDNIGTITNSAAILRIGKTVMPPATARRCLLRINRPAGGIGTANFGEVVVAYATQLGRQLAAEDGTPLDDAAVRTDRGRALGLKPAPTANLSNGLSAALDAGGLLIDVEDGVPVTFDTAYPSAPKIMFLGHNLDAPDASTNEFQQLRALTPSGTGFTPSLKNAISSVTFTTRTNTTATTAMPAQQVEATKNQSGVAASGEKYLAKVVVRDRGNAAFADGVAYTEPVSVTVSFYGRQTAAGPWVYGGSTTYTTAGSYSSSGTRAVEIEGDFGFATWTIHGSSEYKIVIEVGYLAGSREITAFTNVVWKEATGGSITTATALSGGKKGKALIIPAAN